MYFQAVYLSTIAFLPSCYIEVPLFLFFSFFFFDGYLTSLTIDVPEFFNKLHGVDFSVGS